ncbi:MAG: DUF1963 domain-containing protein [Bifidobacteriaceae bacterium]|jgi:uncharacterized protein YwqG|nr:DUF1963 domain-containing protein [Bifidobacteriaceae bacterium]
MDRLFNGGRVRRPLERGAPDTADLRAAWADATALPSVELTASPGAPGLADTKIGGLPYLAPGQEWPALAGGAPELFLLAQLNLGQLPPVAGLPARGLLQFFVAGDDTHGMNYRDPAAGSGHTVLFHPDPSIPGAEPGLGSAEPPARPDLDRAVEYMEVPFTTTEGVRLTGAVTSQPMPPDDFRFAVTVDRLTQGLPGLGSLGDSPGGSPEPWAIAARGHRVGGYARFVHRDPRSDSQFAGFTTLLLQLDSDESAGIVWGDGGACGFFIEPARLAARDFSRVLYGWDCP